MTVSRDSEARSLIRVDLDQQVWKDLVANDPCALAFHHPAWAQMLAECYGFRAFGLGLADDDGRLLAGIPVLETGGRLRGRKWISLPFTDFCPPLVAGDRDLQARLEVEVDAVRLEAGVDSVEVRAAPASDHAAVRASGFRHVLPLDPDPDNVLRAFKGEVRTAIRRSKRSGITVTRAEQERDLTGTFYGLHTATRRRLGVPVQSRRYFSLIWQRLVERGLGFLLIARAAGQPVAAAVFLTLNGTIVMKYSASDAAAWKMRPNNAVFWEAITWACENGYSTWDFGRTDAVDEGLRAFKRRWGAEEVPLTYGIIGRARRSGSAAARAERLAGPLIRHAPPIVCRELGRAFYRYAA